MGTVIEATGRSLQTVTTVSTLVEAGIDRNLASQKPPFRVTPASSFAGYRRADRPGNSAKTHILSRRRHKPAATTTPKTAETLAFPSRAHARPREAPKLSCQLQEELRRLLRVERGLRGLEKRI